MRKKILFIIPYIPYPLDSGGNQAFFNLKSASNLNDNLNCSKELEHYAS